MMIDAFNEFSDAQAVTATALSTNVIDLGPVADNAKRDLGSGERVWLVVITNTTVTDAGSDATLTVTLESATDAAITTGITVHYSSGAQAFATFAPAGSMIAVGLPAGEYARYLAVRYTVGAGPLTAGAFDAFLTHDIQKYRAYADRQPIAAAA